MTFANLLNMACAECNHSIKSNSDSIECYGFCGRKFHFTCVSKNNSSYKKAIIPYLVNIPNLQWYCNDCLPLTFNGTFNGILSKLNKCTDNLNDVVTPIVTQNADAPNSLTDQNVSSQPINTQPTSDNIDIAAPLSQQTSTSSVDTQLNGSSISMADADADTDSDIEFVDNTHSNKRKIRTSRAFKNLKRQKPSLSSVTNDVQLDDLVFNNTETPLNDYVFNKNADCTQSNDASQKKPNIKHIHVSPFCLPTNESNIVGHISTFDSIKNHLGEIACKKLVSEKASKKMKKNLTFVSFKLSVPESCFEILLKSSSWPQGVTATEFVDKSNSKQSPPIRINANKCSALPIKSVKKNSINGKPNNVNRNSRSKSNFRRNSPPINYQRQNVQSTMNSSPPLLHPLLYNQMYQQNQMYQASQIYGNRRN